MKKINLRDYYPFYTMDVIVEVPDEVSDLLRGYALLEEAYRIRTYRHKAYYSLDYEGWTERELVCVHPSPFEILDQRHTSELIYRGLSTLSEKQRQRIYARFFLGMNNAEIARIEGCDISSVRDSIKRGLLRLEKFLAAELQ